MQYGRPNRASNPHEALVANWAATIITTGTGFLTKAGLSD